MKIFGSIFSILVVLSSLSCVAVFIAGSFIFLNIEIYQNIYEVSGPWMACLIVMILTLLFSYLAIEIIRLTFFSIFYKKDKDGNKSFLGLKDKTILFFLFYEILKFSLKRKSNRRKE